MAHTAPASWLTDALAPLGTAFGGALGFARDAGCACWTYEGQRALIELDENVVRARFVASPQADVIDGGNVAAVYAGDDGYPLTPSGCERMVADMLAFFSGVREPQFTFIDAR